MATNNTQKNRNGVKTVGACTVKVDANFTRPANTTQYAAGDVVSDDAASPSIITFSNCAQVDAGSGTIVSAHIVSSAAQGTLPDMELYIFDTSVTAVNDNAAFTVTDAEMRTCVACIAFEQANWKTSALNSRCEGSTGIYNFVCGSGSRDLYGLLVERGTYTPASGERFDIRLNIEQD